jgi:hypothetical protein
LVIHGHGLSVDVPAGWEGRIFRRGDGGPVIHVASFPLHDGDGDFGAAATARMRADDRFLALLEYLPSGRLEPGRGLFETFGRPPAPRPREFGHRRLQVARRGHLGWQRFFTEAGRPFCVYAVIAPVRTPVPRLVSGLAAVLASVQVAPAR